MNKHINYNYRKRQINKMYDKIYFLERDIKDLIRDLKMISIQNNDKLDVQKFLKGSSLSECLEETKEETKL